MMIPFGWGFDAIAGVAGGVKNVRAVLVVQDRGAAIIAAIGIGFCEMKLAERIDLRDYAIICSRNGIGRIDHARCIGIRNIEHVDRRKIAHEGHDTAIGRQIERNLRF